MCGRKSCATRAVVAHFDHGTRTVADHRDRDTRARIRKLDGVGHDIPQHLLQPVGIAPHAWMLEPVDSQHDVAQPEMQVSIGKRRPFHNGPIASSSA
jgi:hypothetical protein